MQILTSKLVFKKILGEQAIIYIFCTSSNRVVPPFVQIMQSFIFDAKHLERDVIGFLFSKKYLIPDVVLVF